MMRAPLRDFIRDLVERTVERTRGEVSQGIQDAIAPIAVEIAQAVGCVLIIAIAFIAMLAIVRISK
jgi:hypothetical protein